MLFTFCEFYLNSLVYLDFNGDYMNSRVIAVAVTVAAVVVLMVAGYTAYASSTDVFSTASSKSPIALGVTAKHTAKHVPCNVGRGFGTAWGVKWGRPWGVEVSSEFEGKVLSILRSNENVSKLLDEGYMLSRIIPAGVKVFIGGDGAVTLKVVKVIAELTKDSSKVRVWVDVEGGSVVKIVSMGVRGKASTTPGSVASGSATA